MRKLEKTDKFIEIIRSINTDVKYMFIGVSSHDDPFCLKLRERLDILEFELCCKIFEGIKPRGNIDIWLEKNIRDKELLPTYKAIMHSNTPSWREVKDELWDDIPNLNETRKYVDRYKVMFGEILTDIYDVEDFRNNPNHGMIKLIKKISSDTLTEDYLMNRMDWILTHLNNWVKDFVKTMDEWHLGAPETPNYNVDLTIPAPQDNSSPTPLLTELSTLKIDNITEQTAIKLYALLIPDVFDYTNMREFYDDLLCNPQELKITKKNLAWTFCRFGYNNIIGNNPKLYKQYKSIFPDWMTKKTGNTTKEEKALKRGIEIIIKSNK